MNLSLRLSCMFKCQGALSYNYHVIKIKSIYIPYRLHAHSAVPTLPNNTDVISLIAVHYYSWSMPLCTGTETGTIYCFYWHRYIRLLSTGQHPPRFTATTLSATIYTISHPNNVVFAEETHLCSRNLRLVLQELLFSSWTTKCFQQSHAKNCNRHRLKDLRSKARKAWGNSICVSWVFSLFGCFWERRRGPHRSGCLCEEQKK